jgi:guanylate kinase
VETVGIFVLPPSAEILEQRLRGRSKDTDDQVRRRLDTACHEIGEFASYDYVVVNDTLDLSVERLRGIVLAERARVGRMRAQAEAIIATFPQACTEEDRVGRVLPDPANL